MWRTMPGYLDAGYLDAEDLITLTGLTTTSRRVRPGSGSIFVGSDEMAPRPGPASGHRTREECYKALHVADGNSGESCSGRRRFWRRR